jgi:hypothetical protein
MSSVDQQRRLSRVERAARARRRRARAHLDRVQYRRSQPKRRSPRVPVRGAALFVLAASLGAGALTTAVWRHGAALESLVVVGLNHVSPAEIAAQSGLEPGLPFADLDSAGLQMRLAEHGWIEGVRTLLLPTGRVVVAVSEREPAAVLMSEASCKRGSARSRAEPCEVREPGAPPQAGPASFAVDAAGIPFAPLGEAATHGLPRIAVAWVPEPGEPDADLRQAVELARRLPELGIPAAEEVGVSAPGDPEGFWLRLTGFAPRVVLGRHDLDTRLADLARLLDAALPALGRAQQVDLRFRDQAVLDVPLPQGAEQAATTHGAAASSTTRPAG